MIDYGKLKLAHELAEACSSHYLVHIVGKKGHEFTLVNWLPDMPDMIFYSEDALIEKLTELTRPKSKYEVGQTIWFLDCEKKIREFIIYTIEIVDQNSGLCRYRDHSGDYVYEKDGLYDTRQELIESQIRYWESLYDKCSYGFDNCSCDERSEKTLPETQMSCSEAIRKHHELEDCQHIDDGEFHRPEGLWGHLKIKCKKCGEFYT